MTHKEYIDRYTDAPNRLAKWEVHHQYYMQIANACRYRPSQYLIDQARRGLARGDDKALNNTISLSMCDKWAEMNRGKLSKILKEFEDHYSLSVGACVIKAALVDAVAEQA